MRVIADVHERSSGIPDHLSERGVTVQVRSLCFADYHVGKGAAVERKTVGDLHASIVERRL
jgi:ERCC4-type nuclease